MRRFLVLIVLVVLAGCGDDSSDTPTVTVGLDFTPNAVHAGIYMARERELGDVRIEIRPPGGGSPDSLKLLETGRADMAVLDIHDLGIARERGADVVAVGALVQRPLAAVIARGDRPILVPSDLEGKRVGVAGLPSDDAVLRAMLSSSGGDFSKVKRVTIGFAAVANLLAGKVDAVTAFWNAEGVVLKQRGLRTIELRLDQLGAPPYPELVLVVQRETLDTRRDDIKRALEAIAAGTDEALVEREQATALIAAASDAAEPLVSAQLDSVAPALEPPVRLDREAVEGWSEFALEFGILERPPDVDEAFDFELAAD